MSTFDIAGLTLLAIMQDLSRVFVELVEDNENEDLFVVKEKHFSFLRSSLCKALVEITQLLGLYFFCCLSLRYSS